jgi:hypothetical protein
MGKFGDVEKQKLNAAVTARIKAALMLLFQMFAGSRANTGRKIQNFIPHLKRIDRDCGSLPFFSKDYHSIKTNKEHVLLCLISKLIQVYWRFISGSPALTETEAAEFMAELDRLEEISRAKFETFQVAGTFPKFTLMSKAKLDAIEVEDAKEERRKASLLEETEQKTASDAVEAKNLMDQALEGDTSGSAQSSSTQSDETVEGGTELGEQSEEQSKEQESSDDSKDDTKEESADSSSETDDLSVEEADRCGSDCDKCTDKVCEPDAAEDDIAAGMADEAKEVDDAPEREDNIAGAVVGGEPCCLDCEMEDQRKTEEADGNEETDLESDAAEEQKSLPAPPAPPEKKTETD